MLAYRLAPEHPFPAALEDVISVYEMLLRNNPATEIVFAGDSAGGGLALAALLKLKEMDRPLPRTAVLLAPWLDLSCESETYASVGAKDLLLGRENLLISAHMYAGNRDLKYPAISPLFADLGGLPPILIQVGTHDVLCGEAKILSDKIKSAGGDVTLEIWPKMMHVWHFMGSRLPEARRAVEAIAAFLMDKLPGTDSKVTK